MGGRHARVHMLAFARPQELFILRKRLVLFIRKSLLHIAAGKLIIGEGIW